MGQKLILTDVSFTDTALPILRDDEGLTAGSLALFDMTHSYVTNVGVPASNAAIYNVAYKEAAAILGSGDASSLALKFINTYASTSEAQFERTGKGALHGAVSLTAQNNHRASIDLSQAMNTYLNGAAQLTKVFALFLWTDVTRIATNGSNLRDYALGNLAAFTSNYLLDGTIANNLGKARTSASKAWTGSQQATISLQAGQLFGWGNTAPYKSLNGNNGRSAILYRAHLIDVAASGLTFAQLDALDLALYNKLFGPGGRYYGDTHSIDPSTIA